MLAAVFSSLHVLALGIGLGAVWARGRALRRVATDSAALARALYADTWWGIAALLWLGSGLTRLFGHLEKGLDFYLYNGWFWVKMGLFTLILLIELPAMVTLIRWRITLGKKGTPDTQSAARLARLNDLEVVLVLGVALVAPMMARGLWLLA